MAQAEHDLIIGNILMRMATLEAKEKDLRTITMDGFVEMRGTFKKIDDRFNQVDEQIDLLAVELVKRTGRLDTKMETMDVKLDRILEALVI